VPGDYPFYFNEIQSTTDFLTGVNFFVGTVVWMIFEFFFHHEISASNTA
jgi:hypothetical protein